MNHICDKCGGPTPAPDAISIYYMHDNHTFSPLKGSIDDILDQARTFGETSPFGMLCPVTLLRGDKEIRRIAPCVHAHRELGETSEWERTVRADADAMRLIDSRK